MANCISARTDRGISNHQAEGSGVLVSTRLNNIAQTVRATIYK